MRKEQSLCDAENKARQWWARASVDCVCAIRAWMCKSSLRSLKPTRGPDTNPHAGDLKSARSERSSSSSSSSWAALIRWGRRRGSALPVCVFIGVGFIFLEASVSASPPCAGMQRPHQEDLSPRLLWEENERDSVCDCKHGTRTTPNYTSDSNEVFYTAQSNVFCYTAHFSASSFPLLWEMRRMNW